MTIQKRRRDSGNATAIALLATFLLSALAASLATVSFSVNETGAGLDNTVLAGYAAEAGLEEIKVAISTSEYTLADGNTWLNENALAFDEARRDFPAAVDLPVFAGLQVGTHEHRRDVETDVWIYSMDDAARKYRAVARSRVGSIEVVLAQDIRARDSFARFATFVDEGVLRFGKTSVRGDVHSNDRIEFHYGEAKFLDRVTASRDFSFQNGAHEGNTSFRDQNRHAAHIPLPSVTDVSAFGQFSSGIYDIRSSNETYAVPGEILDARIELLGDEMRIVAVARSTGEVVKDVVVPLPPDGVLFVEGNVTSIQGKVSKRMTLTTPGKINITGNIVYADGEGDAAMRLEKDGEAVDPASLPPGTAWKEEDGYRYVPNPDFGLAGEDRPALGLMAGYQITLDAAAPHDLEIHAALFSAASNWTADLDVQRGNLRILGSITTKTPGARAQGSMGYAASGEYVYDAALLDSPPPHWLQVDAPFWGPRWRLGW